jgi:DNA polymerase V
VFAVTPQEISLIIGDLSSHLQGLHVMDTGGCSAAEPYALRVIGDSMEPEFQDGHIIIVDPGMPLSDGAYVVIDYNGDTTLRQWAVEGEKKYLKALNDEYPAVEIIGHFHLHGVVVQRATPGRRRDRKNYY